MAIECPKCKGTKFSHKHRCTHMAGTEHFKCENDECGYVIYKEEGERLGFVFILD